MDISTAIKNLRGPGRTQETFARDVGVARQQVVLWEAGKSEPSIVNLQRLVGLGLSPKFLLGTLEATDLARNEHANNKAKAGAGVAA